MSHRTLSFVLGAALAAAATLARADAPPPAQAAHPVASAGPGQAHHAFRSGSVSALPVKGLSARPFKTKDGKTGWRVTIPGGRPLATPAVVGDTVYVGGGFGSHEFYAFDSASGKAKWAIRVSDDGPTAAVVAENRVVFNTESCTLFVVNAQNGKPMWSRWLGDPLMSQPAVADGAVYMAYPGAGGHRLIAMSLETGATKWEQPLAGDIISAPVVEKGAVYVTTFDGTVYKHDEKTGKLAWKEPMHATSAPWIAANGEVHVAKGKAVASGERYEGMQVLDGRSGGAVGGVMAERKADYLDADVQAHSGYAKQNASDDASVGFGGAAPATAKASEAAANVGQSTVKGLWEFQGSRPTVVDGRSFATQGDRLAAVDPKSGKTVWEEKMSGDVKRTGGHLASPPAYAGGKLVVGTTAGTLEGFDAQSGKRVLDIEVGDPIRFQPALVGGRIFAGTERGTLVAVSTGDASLDKWTMWGGGPRHNGAE